MDGGGKSTWLWHRCNKDYVGLTVLGGDRRALAEVSFHKKLTANSATGRRNMTKLPAEDLTLLWELASPLVPGYRLKLRYTDGCDYFTLQALEQQLGITCPWNVADAHFVLCTTAELFSIQGSCVNRIQYIFCILYTVDCGLPCHVFYQSSSDSRHPDQTPWTRSWARGSVGGKHCSTSLWCDWGTLEI